MGVGRKLPAVLTDGTCHDVRVCPREEELRLMGTHLYLLTPAAGAGLMRATKTTGLGRGGRLPIFSLLALPTLWGGGLSRGLLRLLSIDVGLLVHLLDGVLSFRGADVELGVWWEDVCHRDRLAALSDPRPRRFGSLEPIDSLNFIKLSHALK